MHTIGIYHFKISACLEPYCLHTALNHMIISNLCVIFTYSIPLYVSDLIPGMLNIIFLNGELSSCLFPTTFGFAWKTATLLASLMWNIAQIWCCYSLIIRIFFCSVMLLFLFWHQMVKLNDLVIYHLRFTSNLVLIFALSFTWRLTYTIPSLLAKCQLDLMCALYFGVTIGRTCLLVLKWFLLSWGRFWVLQRVICFLVVSVVLQCQQPLWLVFHWCPSCRQVTGPEFLPNVSTYITTTDQHHASVQWVVVGLSE